MISTAGDGVACECLQCRPQNQIYTGADKDSCHCPYPEQGLHCGKKPRASLWDAILADVYENGADALLKSAVMVYRSQVVNSRDKLGFSQRCHTHIFYVRVHVLTEAGMKRDSNLSVKECLKLPGRRRNLARRRALFIKNRQMLKTKNMTPTM